MDDKQYLVEFEQSLPNGQLHQHSTWAATRAEAQLAAFQHAIMVEDLDNVTIHFSRTLKPRSGGVRTAFSSGSWRLPSSPQEPPHG